MARLICTLNILFVLCVVALMTPMIYASVGERKVFIVYMGNIVEADNQSLSAFHISMLQQVVDIRFAENSLVRSYTRSFNGFAANLTTEEHQLLANRPEVLSTFPSTRYRMQTTRSWDFMGFSENVDRVPTIESDIIIGMIDSGIWPESPSFDDIGFTPPPTKWRGACNGGKNFTCNNKLIGARSYNSDWDTRFNDPSARDIEGHGTHTSSIAAGNNIKDASFFGVAEGTARGGVPSARIAAYRVCYPDHIGVACLSEDILAAFDDAIADGVDFVSISIGGPEPFPLAKDSVAIGSFHAMQKGILVVQSAGTGGDSPSSTAPWILTVAASTTDRDIISKVDLGNGTPLIGRAVNSFRLNGTTFPVVYGKTASTRCNEDSAQLCEDNCLSNDLVKGKIVVCTNFRGLYEAYRQGALGSIVLRDYLTVPNISQILPIPGSALEEEDFDVVLSYINHTTHPMANILPSESQKNLDAPLVPFFSSRGPNANIPNILKPDVVAPGVDILAAFSPIVSPSDNPGFDNRAANYSILTGTSVACPHGTGAAAYIKTLHPDWSPSAIKSSLMTTANSVSDPDAEFAYGSGLINPSKAIDPGLVYDILPDEYSRMLCSLGNERNAFGVNCSDGVILFPKDLNYPAITFRIPSNTSTTFSQTFARTVTNVGYANSTYKALTSASSDYNITVNPNILMFEALNEKKDFQVTVSGEMKQPMISATLEWFDGFHHVRTPINVYTDEYKPNA